jgi:hypothetical protein
MKKEINLRIPDNFQELDETVMSNFDGRVDKDVASKIKNQSFYADYTGWNFFAKVWWQNKKWHCEVWQYRNYQETFSAKSLPELRTLVSDEYGYE